MSVRSRRTARTTITQTTTLGADRPRLRRVGYRTYEIATGPACGVVLRRTGNPDALPYYRWTASTGAHDFTLRGLVKLVSEEEAAREIRRLEGV